MEEKEIEMDKKYLPSVVILYLNYFIHGIGCSLLSQQVVKEMLAAQWGVGDVMTVSSIGTWTTGFPSFCRTFV